VLQSYLENDIYAVDPFVTIDRGGVGELMRIAVERGRGRKPNLKLGICGEHGGDPSSVEFCHQLGLDYVSCSPYRLPIARLAAAQAALREQAARPEKARKGARAEKAPRPKKAPKAAGKAAARSVARNGGEKTRGTNRGLAVPGLKTRKKKVHARPQARA
jgi:pyruvate, orthophosphate dikinase